MKYFSADGKYRLYCIVFSLILFSGLLWAQIPVKPIPEQYSWRVLEQAQLAFEDDKYGTALRLVEQARINRRNESDWAMYVLTQALKPETVKRAGDDISLLVDKLEERLSVDALLVLDRVFNKSPPSAFNNSMSTVLDALSSSWIYPEADLLLGRIYIIEGEYALAEKYLLAAWENKEYLDIPDFQYTILYELSSLSALQENWGKYEEYLLLVLASDSAYAQNGEDSPFLDAILRALGNGISLDKFFMLYRHPVYTEIPAYIQLASYYMKSGRIDRALPVSLLGSLAVFTRMYESVKERDDEFIYTTFSNSLQKMLTISSVKEWSIENNIWEAFYILALALYDHGDRSIALDLFRVISLNSPEEYWQQSALKQFIQKT